MTLEDQQEESEFKQTENKINQQYLYEEKDEEQESKEELKEQVSINEIIIDPQTMSQFLETSSIRVKEEELENDENIHDKTPSIIMMMDKKGDEDKETNDNKLNSSSIILSNKNAQEEQLKQDDLKSKQNNNNTRKEEQQQLKEIKGGFIEPPKCNELVKFFNQYKGKLYDQLFSSYFNK